MSEHWFDALTRRSTRRDVLALGALGALSLGGTGRQMAFSEAAEAACEGGSEKKCKATAKRWLREALQECLPLDSEGAWTFMDCHNGFVHVYLGRLKHCHSDCKKPKKKPSNPQPGPPPVPPPAPPAPPKCPADWTVCGNGCIAPGYKCCDGTYPCPGNYNCCTYKGLGYCESLPRCP